MHSGVIRRSTSNTSHFSCVISTFDIVAISSLPLTVALKSKSFSPGRLPPRAKPPHADKCKYALLRPPPSPLPLPLTAPSRSSLSLSGLSQSRRCRGQRQRKPCFLCFVQLCIKREKTCFAICGTQVPRKWWLRRQPLSVVLVSKPPGIHIFIHTYLYAFLYTHLYAHAYTHFYMPMITHMPMHISMPTCPDACLSQYTHVYTHV